MALHLLVDRITQSLDNNESFVDVALDFRKAFDTIDFTVLLEKLCTYGVCGIAHRWLSSYISGRKQFVALDDVISESLDIKCGVPQGSILGPILFLLYINDLPCSTDLLPIIFADDTNVFASGKSVSECIAKINFEMTRLLSWIRTNKLSLNVEKHIT